MNSDTVIGTFVKHQSLYFVKHQSEQCEVHGSKETFYIITIEMGLIFSSHAPKTTEHFEI